MVKSYRDLVVWQKSIQLSRSVYELTSKFPKSELYGLTAQMCRGSVSIASNIAEGSRRGTRKDFRHFIHIAFGAGAELETQIEVAKVLPFGKNLDYHETENLLNEVMRMLNVLERKLSPTHYSLPTTHYLLLTNHGYSLIWNPRLGQRHTSQEARGGIWF